MAYAIKRSTSTQNNTIKSGRLVVGVEEIEYDSSYVNGVSPPDNGFIFILEGPPPLFHSFSNESDLISYYDREYTSVSTLDDVLTAIANNDAHLLVAAETPTTIDAEPAQKGRNLTNNPASEGKLVRGKGKKSNNKTQHGFEWVCMVTSTVNYCAIYPGTVISEINPSTGVLTTKVSSTSNPQVGNIGMTAGRIYTSNKPVHYLDQGSGEVVFPLSYRGTLFGFYYSRYSNQTVYIYATEDNTNVKFWKSKIAGNGEVIQEYNLNEGDLQTFNGNYEDEYYHFQSNKPVCITARGSSGDRSILPQASSNYSYRRYNEYERTIAGTGPSTNGTYVIKDDVPCWAISIADGSGGEAESSIPLDYLTDTYAFGAGSLRSYFIVSPYTNTITVSYYSGGTWVEYDSHTENGTLSSPSVHSEGSQNGGTDLVSGLGTVPWKFEGTNPFYIVVNDGSSDEEALFGWNRNEKILTFSF